MKLDHPAHPASATLENAEPPLAWHKPGRLRLEELDGLRGILALYVVIYHLQAPLEGVSRMLRLYLPITFEAWFAVDVFFVMSGFVMMYVYGRTFSDGVDWSAYRRFFAARVARLYPVHLFALAAIAVLVLPRVHDTPEFLSPDGRYSWTSGVASLLMLHSPWIDHRSWNFPSWSISAEWHAYALFPFLAVLANRWSTAVAWLVVGIGVLIPLALYLGDLSGEREPTNGLLVLLRVVPLFACGIALHGLNRIVGHRTAGFLSGLVLVAAILVLLSLPKLAPLAVLLVPVLVLFSLNSPALKRVLGSRPAVFLGAISYSLYMTHALVAIFGLGLWVRQIAPRLGLDAASPAASNWAMLVAATLGSLALGWLTFRFVEVPCRNALVRRFS